MFKQSKLYSIVYNKCPRCHEGDFFVSNHIFTKDFDKMYKECPACGERYSPEPGFYFGAAYISYALYVALIVVAFVVVVGFLDYKPIKLLYFLVPLLVLLTPLFYRLARRIWINLFVDYNPAFKKHQQ